MGCYTRPGELPSHPWHRGELGTMSGGQGPLFLLPLLAVYLGVDPGAWGSGGLGETGAGVQGRGRQRDWRSIGTCP